MKLSGFTGCGCSLGGKFRKGKNSFVFFRQSRFLLFLLSLSVVKMADGQVSDNRWLKIDRMAVRTNLVMDALAVPNIGAEFSLNDRWSFGGTYFHSWWSDESSRWCWRTYGGELEIRYWLGERKGGTLTGHHFGLYSHILTYDLKRKLRDGYQSRFSYGAGLSYGYTLPINRCWQIDFGAGLGYLGGNYDVYRPLHGCNVWQETRQRNFFGPTKLEVSFRYIIDNPFRKKGGSYEK